MSRGISTFKIETTDDFDHSVNYWQQQPKEGRKWRERKPHVFLLTYHCIVIYQR